MIGVGGTRRWRPLHGFAATAIYMKTPLKNDEEDQTNEARTTVTRTHTQKKRQQSFQLENMRKHTHCRFLVLGNAPCAHPLAFTNVAPQLSNLREARRVLEDPWFVHSCGGQQHAQAQRSSRVQNDQEHEHSSGGMSHDRNKQNATYPACLLVSSVDVKGGGGEKAHIVSKHQRTQRDTHP